MLNLILWTFKLGLNVQPIHQIVEKYHILHDIKNDYNICYGSKVMARRAHVRYDVRARANHSLSQPYYFMYSNFFFW